MRSAGVVILAVVCCASFAGAAEEWSFATQVLPVLTKAGCNAGACHGAATGQGGFALSLLGYHPEADHAAITRELSGRRIDVAEPAESLLLRKASRDMKHKGGLRIEEGSEDYRLLAEWIREGAAYGLRELQVKGLSAEPGEVWAKGVGESAGLRVVATLSDGRTKDVTKHAVYDSNDDAVAEVNAAGKVTVRRRGLTAVMVRYGGQVAAVSVAAPIGDAEVAVGEFEERNFVDRHVLAQLKRMRVTPSPLSGDAAFFRRVHLDLVGALPTAWEAREFLKRPATAEDRQGVIDRLLCDDRFTDVWTMRLAELLLIDSGRLGEQAATSYYLWLRRKVSERWAVDGVVRELLTSRGGSNVGPGADGSDVGPENFLRIAQDPRDVGEQVSSMLLGVRVACARCHAHPFAAWTQGDYHEFAAFFASGRKGAGEVRHPLTGKVASPRALGETKGVKDGADVRGELAAWVTSPENPYFAQAFVNRVWRELMGRGLVEPVDDFRVTNPPTNPALLDALAGDFMKHGYDLRRLVRVIASSRAYQATSKAAGNNVGDDRLFARAYVRPIGPAVLLDAVADATGAELSFKGYARGTRAVMLIDARVASEELDALGRCRRSARCEPALGGAGGLAQALHLMNGTAINGKLAASTFAARLSREEWGDGDVVEEMFLQALSRRPSDAERAHFAGELVNAKDRAAAIEDLLWALLNSREFVFNH